MKIQIITAPGNSSNHHNKILIINLHNLNSTLSPGKVTEREREMHH